MQGAVAEFEVTLDSPGGIYSPGECLSGSVHLKLRADSKVYGVYIWILGQADVSWSDKPGSKRTHAEYELYMKECLTLWGREPGQRRCSHVADLALPAGGHEYRFQYRLPERLPSSFESARVCKGRVHYILRAKLESPDETARKSLDKIFIVLNTLDLNIEKKCMESVQLRKDRFLCCACCKSGPLSCALRLDRTGYVPGEDINLDAEIQNMSRKDISTSYVTLQQIVYFHAQGDTKSSTTDIFRISGGKIKPGDNALFHDIIHIPPLPPSRLDGCHLIDIEYVVTVGVMLSGTTTTVEVSVLITIGTIPLRHILPPVPPSYSRYSHSSGEIEDYDDAAYAEGKHQHVYTYYKSLYKNVNSMELFDGRVTST